jgi:hypothetical protein
MTKTRLRTPRTGAGRAGVICHRRRVFSVLEPKDRRVQRLRCPHGIERDQVMAVRRHLPTDLQVAVSIAFGWRMQSEVLTLERGQLDVKAGTVRLEPGTTKNDDGRICLPHSRPRRGPGGSARARASTRAPARPHRPVGVPHRSKGSRAGTSARPGRRPARPRACRVGSG